MVSTLGSARLAGRLRLGMAQCTALGMREIRLITVVLGPSFTRIEDRNACKTDLYAKTPRRSTAFFPSQTQ